MPTGINTIIIDAAAIVNMIKSFLPFIEAQLRHADRVDIVRDKYIENSLKATTRSHRGTGVRRRDTPSASPQLELLPSRGFLQARAPYVCGRFRELP